jgi:glutathione S-transferase
VPILRHGAFTVWDSLAIVEYLAERFPEAGLWPEAPEARATARSICAEMHAGFAALRNQMPMNLRQPGQPPPGSEELARDIARVTDIWTDCRTRFGNSGAFLFGEFTAADAYYAPVATRFATYSVPLEGTAAAYRDAISAWPDFQEWCAAAAGEPWVIRFPAPD